jgi:hypothetical protein
MTNPPPDSGTLVTIASVIAAFGAAMLFFRVQREILMKTKGERNWIPWADRLLVAATLLCLLFVILPLVALDPNTTIYKAVPSAVSAASAILVAGYPFAILAHYRFILAGSRTRKRDNPEPSEKIVVLLTALAAIGVLVWLVCIRIL